MKFFYKKNATLGNPKKGDHQSRIGPQPPLTNKLEFIFLQNNNNNNNNSNNKIP